MNSISAAWALTVWFPPKQAALRLTLPLLLLIALGLSAQHYRLFERLWFNLSAWYQQDALRARSVWLPDYVAELQGKVIEGLDDNLSALSYDSERKVLVSVTNQPPQMVELSLDGHLLRRVALHGFSDPEAIEYIGPGRYVIADEREQRLVEAYIAPGAESFDATDAPRVALGLGLNGNKGFEGLAYDSGKRRLLVAKERDPLRIYGIDGFPRTSPQAPFDIRVTADEARDAQLFVRDLSSLDYDAASGHLLALSDESRLLLELDREGHPISTLSLLAGQQGLDHSVPQAEGVAMDDQVVIYLISEPNLFYRFVPRRPEAR
ncbi:SdiA-regulated domain-containing protein [Pseudomonas aeruginosa]